VGIIRRFTSEFYIGALKMAEAKNPTNQKSKVQALAELEKQRLELTAKIEADRAEALAEIIATAKTQAGEIGVSMAELVKAMQGTNSKPAKTAGGRAKVAPKYQNPKNHADVWSGRGISPKWFTEAKKAGVSAESLTIEAQTKKP